MITLTEKESVQAILAECEKKKETLLLQLEEINALEAQLKETVVVEGRRASDEKGRRNFGGLTIASAIAVYLSEQGGVRSTQEIQKALEKGGIKGTAHFYNTVATTLTKNTKMFEKAGRARWKLSSSAKKTV